MFEFLNGAEATAEIRRLVASSQRVRLAVAFWGSGAAEEMGLETRAGPPNMHRPQIICNLASGGTNPDEIERVMMGNRLDVSQCDTLHGKVYLFDNCFILGSSNASANGLAMQGNERSGWHEANVISDDAAAHKKILNWIDSLPKRAITGNDLKTARAKFERRRQLLSNAWPMGINLLEALVVWPERFRDKKIYLTYYTEEINAIQRRDIQKEQEKIENIGRDVDAVGYRLETSSYYVGFWFDEEKEHVEYGEYFRTADSEWTNGRDTYNKVWFCEMINKINGIRKLGPLRIWSTAIVAANNAIHIGAIPDEPIEIGIFHDRFIKDNQNLAPYIQHAKETYGG